VDPQNDKNMMGNSIDNDQDIGSLWRILSQLQILPTISNTSKSLFLILIPIDVIGVDIW
jgi:hypothetical protein